MQYRPYSWRPRVGRRLKSPAPPIRGRAERQGSGWTHAPRRLATSRLAEAVRNASPPNQWRPARGVCEVCSASVSVGDPFVRCARYRRHDAPPADPGHSAWHALTSMQIGLPGRQGGLACGLHAGLDAAWTAGGDKWRRISNAPNRPPRPASASGVLIKRPSVVEAGYLEYRPSLGFKSRADQK